MAKVLIVGNGGREDALGWKFAQSPHVDEVIHAAGNAGTEGGKRRNVSLTGKRDLVEYVQREPVDLLVVGPEAPLVDGLADEAQEYVPVFGPSRAAARLEADKFFSCQIMEALGISQAGAEICTTGQDIKAVLRLWNPKEGVVLKARGLHGGKGVVVYDSPQEAMADLSRFVKNFGGEALVAERLYGDEFSVFGIADGNTVAVMSKTFQDSKRLYDDNNGPNTGGMGAYGPWSGANANLVQRINDEIMIPVVQAMKAESAEYRGFLYAGMMMTKEGPKVLEFNVRMGDPECQPAMMLLKSDLYEILMLATQGKLNEVRMEFKPGASCCVVLATPGYAVDDKAMKAHLGQPISSLDEAKGMENVQVFHAGTAIKDGTVVNTSGRVLGATAYAAEGIAAASDRAYQAAAKITIPGGFQYRRDIGTQR